MNRLKDIFGKSELAKLERLDQGIKQALCDSYEVNSVLDLPEEGYVFIQVVLNEKVSEEEMKALVARGMGIDVETVEIDAAKERSIIGEMSVGSHLIPWPLYALALLDQVDELLKPHGLTAGIHF